MFFRHVTSLAMACTVGAYCSYLRADGFWDLQTLADDVRDTQALTYDARTYSAQAFNAPTYYTPTHYTPTHYTPTYNGTAYPPRAFTKRSAANPALMSYVDKRKFNETVEAASIHEPNQPSTATLASAIARR